MIDLDNLFLFYIKSIFHPIKKHFDRITTFLLTQYIYTKAISGENRPFLTLKEEFLYGIRDFFLFTRRVISISSGTNSNYLRIKKQ